MEDITALCELAYKYGTDKCPQIRHSYTKFYYKLFNNSKESFKKVLEIGIDKGASLRMWRDFFPNAQIYGADIEQNTLFHEDRIQTFLCDSVSASDTKQLINQTGSDIDLCVDDGCHGKEAQIATCLNILPLLDKNIVYIIEDIGFPGTVLRGLKDYDCQVKRFHSQLGKDNLIIVRTKP